MNHWAQIAFKGGNAKTRWIIFRYDGMIFSKEIRSPKFVIFVLTFTNSFDLTVTKRAAQSGMLSAWMSLGIDYQDGLHGISVNLTRSFASYYTVYLLTRSPYMANDIWKLSQGQYVNKFSPEEILRGKAIARRNFRELQEGKKPAIPFTH